MFELFEVGERPLRGDDEKVFRGRNLTPSEDVGDEKGPESTLDDEPSPKILAPSQRCQVPGENEVVSCVII